MLKDAIEKIKDKLTVSGIVGQRVKLKRSGNRFMGLCPFHDEKTPSFSVNDGGGFFHCFGCGKRGDVIDFVSETENLSFIEALEKLAAIAGVTIKKAEKENQTSAGVQKFLSDISLWFQENLHSPLGKNAKKYIEGRISPQTIAEFKIGYCPKDISVFLKQKNIPKAIIQESGIVDQNGRCYFSGRLIFPIHSKKGAVIGFGSRAVGAGTVPKYINSGETEIFKKSEILYGIDTASKFCKESLIIVEGYMDVLCLFQHGYNNAVGVLGTSVTLLHLEKLFKLSKKLIFCFDGDTAGVGAAKKVIRLIFENFLEKTDVKTEFVFLPDGCDPDDILKDNPNAFDALLKGAKIVSEAVFFLGTVNKTFQVPEDFIALEQNLRSYVDLIKDRATQNHFKDFFKNQVFQMKRYKKFSSSSSNLKLLSVSKKTEKSEVLLKIALDYPQILQNAEAEDCFSMISFAQKDAKAIQQHLISFLNSNQDGKEIEKEALMHFFNQSHELKSTLEDFLQKVTNFHIHNYDQAKILWDKIISEIEHENLQKEYQNLLGSPELTEEIMQKAQNILQQIQKKIP